MTTEFSSECTQAYIVSDLKQVKLQHDSTWYFVLFTIVWLFFYQVKALQNEISILKNVKHERIVTFYGSEEKDDHLYLFMDFMPGVRKSFDLVLLPGSSIDA